MVRLFHVYYPMRAVVLMLGEAAIVLASLLMATFIQYGPASLWVLNQGNGLLRIMLVTAIALLCIYYFDLYSPEYLRAHARAFLRLLTALGVLSLLIAGLGYLFPGLMLGKGVFLLGLMLLTCGQLAWRSAFSWLICQPYLPRERVLVLGHGERTRRLVQAIRTRDELGMELVGWTGAIGSVSRKEAAQSLEAIKNEHSVDRVIVSLPDRRGTIPVRELLDLRLQGIKVEDSTALLEKESGKIELDDLQPSWLIFSDGFRLNRSFIFALRVGSFFVSLACLLLCLPVIPLVALAIKISSPGPIFYRQKRVGLNGIQFHCYKFRTMRPDAEADCGPTWAGDDDPRITPVGRILRMTRVDEIPQLWNVLRGDMVFVGPRPERPEFVEWLSREIPYYPLRHVVRPGVTGWAQVRYKYGSSLEDAREKLKYDLFYIKNISFGLDLLILLQTIKVVLFGKGAR